MHHRLRTPSNHGRWGRSTLALLTAVLLTFVGHGSALAQVPPSNDTINNPIEVTASGTVTEDTTDAGTDATDTVLRRACGQTSSTNNSVWFSITPDTDQFVVVDTSQTTDFTAGIIVATNAADPLLLTCGSPTVSFAATAHTTYYIMASSWFGTGPGELVISFSLQPLPTIEITVNGSGSFNSHTGAATVSGTYTCTLAGAVEVSVILQQKTKNGSVVAFGSLPTPDRGTCDGTPHDWSITVPEGPFGGGVFSGGKAQLTAFASVGDTNFTIQYNFAQVTQLIQLKGGG